MLVAHFVPEFGERSGIRGIHGINAIRGIETATHLSFTLVLKHLPLAGVLLSLLSRDGTTYSLHGGSRTENVYA